MLTRLGVGLVWILAGLCTAWALAAVWIDGREQLAVPAILIVLGIGVSFALGRRTQRWGIRGVIAALPFVLVLCWWLSLTASNDRDWIADVRELPRAEIDGDRLVIHNVRNFDYRSETDFTERWETREYDLGELRGVDLFMSYWGSPMIAHTIASWDFGDGRPLAISIETRKEEGEAYSAILGFFRQFELYYVIADERDVVRVRTNFRGETVRLYRTTASAQTARAILIDYLSEINALRESPAWYHAATHNCTTTIRHHVRHVARGGSFDYRILVNGSLDELGYERGNVDTSLPFEELRQRSDITARAISAGDSQEFSKLIRVDLPNPRQR